jgi:sulfur transfer complex TusBCD TusB component (DsrH family)
MSYKDIEVTCPTCSLVKVIKVPLRIFTQKKFGTIKIQVPQGGVCKEHQFIVFVDTKGIIRGYDRIDLLMKKVAEREDERRRFSIKHFIDVYGLYGVFCLIHAKIFNYPAYIIRDKESEDFSYVINKIGDRLLPEAYHGTSNVSFLDETDYNKIKINDKNAFLMDTHQHILQTPWEEKLKFEEEMIKKALDILDEEEQVRLIQQSVSKLVIEAEYVKRVLEKEKEIYEEDLINRIARELMIPKPNFYRISLIKDFIKQRYSPKLAAKIKSKVEDFLNLL